MKIEVQTTVLMRLGGQQIIHQIYPKFIKNNIVNLRYTCT